MKKLLVALILAVVLTLTLATPAFAGPPEDKPGKMPDGTNNMPPQGRDALVHANDAMFGLAMGGGWGPVTAHATIYQILGWFHFPGGPPGIWQVWIFSY